MTPRAGPLAPFAVRSFRFQWPADFAASWAFEMDALILGWYVLTATGSVEQLVVFGALTWLGALFSPFFGVAADRVGHRALLCVTRGIYAALAAVLLALTVSGALVPWHVFVIAALAGLLRPSDMVMRQALVAQTMRPDMLLGALGISRTTYDTAKIAGALTGTAGVALVGMAAAYAVVTALYIAAFLFSLGVARAPQGTRHGAEPHPLAALTQAFGYVWTKPELLTAFAIAFLVNLLAYPFFLGLLPYVAKEFFASGQAGLGYLAVAYAIGGMAGSVVVGASRVPLRAARAMLAGGAAWFAVILVLGQIPILAVGLALLFVAGLVQSLCMVPLAAVMLRSSADEMRGRVMGMRQLAVWGLPLGLVASGPVIAHFGFPATTVLYAGLGLVAMLAIGYRWRRALWDREAPANARI